MLALRTTITAAALAVVGVLWITEPVSADSFEGRYFRGNGDVEYLRLLDISRRMFEPDAEFQGMPMLYMPEWNGLVEGPTWGAWWIQNSYGTTYCALPFYQEPFVTFLQNSQDLWFDQMGDGKRKGASPPFDWIAPDGCLCDAARPGWIVYRQGDGRARIHDWGMEFTAAGVVLQAELLLIGRDMKAIAHYLPKLERSANFVETRRDPGNNLFLAGPAGNLLAPSYAGWKRPDGTYDKAYLAGLSITHIAALDRLIELEKLAGNADMAQRYVERRDLARKGLGLLTTDEGYFIKSLDPDGTRHGVFGAAKHGYFEASPNHDAIAFRVVDDAQAAKIYAKIASMPGLRRYDLIIPNCPGLDDMYEEPKGLWAFGHWVNGGHWTTCEARMIMGYYRLGHYDDARRSMQRILGFARKFRMDNNLTNFGSEVYQPHQPINLTYDIFGAPAAMIRGLFEYLYRADGLTILPHIPPGITDIEQRFPIRFGTKKLYLRAIGTGPVTDVYVNGKRWSSYDATSVSLPYERTPDAAMIEIVLGMAKPALRVKPSVDAAEALSPLPPADDAVWKSGVTSISKNELPLRIGADSNGDNRFVGDIARVRVFNRALNAAEIAAAAKDRAAPAVKDSALVADWSFDSVKDGVFANQAGDGLPARIVGEAQVADAPGGKALRLTGKGWVEVAPNTRIDLTESCTLDAWIRPKTLPSGGGRIIDKSRAGTADGYLLDTCPGDSLRLIVGAGSVGYDAKLPADEWSHVAATVDVAGRQTLYVNGRVVATQTPPAVPSLLEMASRIRDFHARLVAAGLGESYEATHAKLAIESILTMRDRQRMLAEGKIKPLPEAPRAAAAERSYRDTAVKLCEGLAKTLASYAKSDDSQKRRVYEIWQDVPK